MNAALISLLVQTGIDVTLKLLANHAGKPVSEMTEAEMIAGINAIRIKTPEELIAEGD